MGIKLIGIDFETTGLDTETLMITEVGLVGYDTDFGSSPVASYSMLNSEAVDIEPMAEKITGISEKKCRAYGKRLDLIKDDVCEFVQDFEPDYMVAHNGRTFDEVIFKRFFLKGYKFIDTVTDLPLKTYDDLRTGQLELMAARLGFVNPFPHAALPDVMTMMKILLIHNIHEVIERSKSPMLDVIAQVSFEEKDLAKAQGFGWQQYRGGKTYTKKWTKTIKEMDLEAVSKEWKFNWYKA